MTMNIAMHLKNIRSGKGVRLGFRLHLGLRLSFQLVLGVVYIIKLCVECNTYTTNFFIFLDT